MIEIISIHIPKTGGTSFYHILKQVYGKRLSVPFKRSDYQKAVADGNTLQSSLPAELEVLHGHFYYCEIKKIHVEHRPKIICWLRDPVERVISNYRFFREGLQNPQRNAVQYELNKHRASESLLEYASKEENRNRMTQFLKGIALEELFFVGIMENYANDIQRLAKRLNWPDVAIPHLNNGQLTSPVIAEAEDVKKQLMEWNKQDMALYQKANAMLKQIENG